MGEKIKAPESMLLQLLDVRLCVDPWGKKLKPQKISLRKKIKAARESVNPLSGCPTVCRSVGEKSKTPEKLMAEKN